jgi:ABC-type glycerol-3-phosphate transport system permease component
MTAVTMSVVGEAERTASVRRNAAFTSALVLAIFWIAPILILAMNAFKTPNEFLMTSGLTPPSGFALFDNIAKAWAKGLGSGFINSLLYGVVSSVGAVLLASLAAFGIVRLKIPQGLFWFLLIYSGTIFPFQMYLIPLFFGYQQFGILNSRIGMILFYTAICTPFPTLVLKNYMSQISAEIDEAARMDGAREFRIFLSIILPNCVGPMVALFLLQFTWIWNDLLFSSVLGNREEIRSVMNSLQVFQGNYVTTGPNIALTASLLATVPCVLIFLALRKRFMAGLQVLT